MSRAFLVACVGVSAAFAALTPGAIGGDDAIDPRLEKVLADWQRRQHWFDAVKYEVAGKHVVPQGAYSDAISKEERALLHLTFAPVTPPKTMEGPVSYTILLDFIKGRERRSVLEQTFNSDSGGKLTGNERLDAFNGTEMSILLPKDKNPDLNVKQPELMIVKGNLKNFEFRSVFFPVFFGHGRIYTGLEPILPGHFRNEPNSKNLYVHGTGVYKERACLIIRTKPLDLTPPPYIEYWIDTGRDNAIVRYMLYGGGILSDEIGIDYAMTAGRWLPSSWRWTALLDGKVLYFEDINVQKITVNPPVTNNEFELSPIKTGMLVEERTELPTSNPIETPKSEFSVYRIDNNGERIPIPDPLHRRGDQYEQNRPDRWGRQAWLAVFLVIVFGCVGAIFLRRVRKLNRQQNA